MLERQNTRNSVWMDGALERLDRWMDGWKNGQNARKIDGEMDGQMNFDQVDVYQLI